MRRNCNLLALLLVLTSYLRKLGSTMSPCGHPLSFLTLFSTCCKLLAGKYTREKLKAYKSLEAYSYFLSDWVGTCYYHKITDSEFCAIKAAVRPSPRLSEKPHRPWVGLRQKDGSISVAHCTCMTG